MTTPNLHFFEDTKLVSESPQPLLHEFLDTKSTCNMPTSFRTTAIYFILSRYVFSFQLVVFSSTGRTNEPSTSIRGGVQASTVQCWHRRYYSNANNDPLWSPTSLQASSRHHSYCNRGNSMLRDERQRRRQRILTWLPRKIRSTLRGIVSILMPRQDTTKVLLDAPVVTRRDDTRSEDRSAVLSMEEVLPKLATITNSSSSTNLSQQALQTSRSETAASSTDLTGSWRLMVTSDFKQQYDKYLKLLGQSMLVRSVAISIIGMTTEETRQDDSGRSLWIKGTNPRGVWERILVSSIDSAAAVDPKQFEIQTIDKETVQAEAWWEDDGSRHRSWLKGVSKYGGGSFESIRYLESPDVLVCESAFHPDDTKREIARVTWRFARTESS